MSQAEMFNKLGAPLNNTRWSWGSVRESDGTVFLRVWQDGTMKMDGKRYVWLSELNPPDSDLGAKERLYHTELVMSGRTCYLVMCQAIDTSAVPRAVRSFNERELFETGGVITEQGGYWIELKGRIAVDRVIA